MKGLHFFCAGLSIIIFIVDPISSLQTCLSMFLPIQM